MEISSVSNLYPQDPSRRSDKNQEAKKTSGEQKTESFQGPNTGELIKKLRTEDFDREELIGDVKDQIKAGNYFTEERIQKVVEKLSSQL